MPRPLFVYFRNVSIASAAMFTGDFICQRYFHSDKSWDYIHSLKLALTGFCVSGPLNHVTYMMLERFFPGKMTKDIVKKLCGSMFFACPSMGVTFTTVGLLEGKSSESIKTKLRKDWLPTYFMGYFYWIPINMVQYMFIPVYNRPMVASFASAFWNIYIARQSTKPVSQPLEEPLRAAIIHSREEGTNVELRDESGSAITTHIPTEPFYHLLTRALTHSLNHYAEMSQYMIV